MKKLRVRFYLRNGMYRDFVMTEAELEKLSKQQPNAGKWVVVPNAYNGVTMLRDDEIVLIDANTYVEDSGDR
ncbi:MAG TPA: hypothetical protein VGK73_17500 [Polyangiaceae bacterium]